MLVKLFPSLENNKIVVLLNKFLYSYFYVAFIALLTALTCIFGFEMYTYYIYVALGGILPCLFSKDMTPMIAPLGMAYSSVSLKTKDVTTGSTLFAGRWYHLFILLTLIAIFVGGRLIFELISNKEKRNYRPYLTYSYIAFGLCLICAGINTPYYSIKEFTFGLVEALALSGCYFLLIYLINWKDIKKDYYAYLTLFYGLALVLEVFVLRMMNNGEHIRTGWGVNNNVAGQLCICLAGPIYLAIKKKWAPIYLISEGFILLAAGLTNSRSGALMGTIICVASLVIFYIKVDKKKRIQSIIIGVVAISSFVAFAFIFIDIFKTGFAKLIGLESDPFSLSGRDLIWKNGYENFLANPSFGLGWYQCQMGRSDYFTYSFIPARYHNTFFQIIGTCGLFGLIAYIYHRYQTVKMTFKKPTLEKTFVFISILGLLLTSLFDCHFFNLGPGLNYCIALAFIEGMSIATN